MTTSKSRAIFKAFWNVYINAVNLTPTTLRSLANFFIAVFFYNIQPTFSFLADILNRMQQYTYAPAYCLRRKKT